MTQSLRSQPLASRSRLLVSVDDAVTPVRMLDEEAQVRQLFQTNPAQGCSWLFRRYYASLCNHALRFVYGREVAEDIVGEVFCTFWTERAFERVTTSYRAYLFKAVRYRAYNYLRWELDRSAGPISDLTDPTAERPAIDPFDQQSPAEVLQYDELYAAVNQAIAELPPQCRRVFLMSRFEQKPYRDIAQELGITVKAVEANVSRALTTLRRVLKNGFLFLLLAGCALL